VTSHVTGNRLYEVKTRLVYGSRCISKGRKSAQTLCSVMDMPLSSTKFSIQMDFINQCMCQVTEAFMSIATERKLEMIKRTL
jgi:hypothetical protein